MQQKTEKNMEMVAFISRRQMGLVAGRESRDVSVIARALRAEDEPIRAAGLKPSREQLMMFARANGLRVRETVEDYAAAREERRTNRAGRREGGQEKGAAYTEFTDLLKLFLQAASQLGSQAQDLYFLCDLTDMLGVARLVEEIPLNLRDRYTFCIAPVDTKQAELMAFLRFFARQYQHRKEVKLGMDILSERVPVTPLELKHLEEVHAVLDVYLWLGLRFGEDVFVEMDEAEEAAVRCSELIEEGLKTLKPKEFTLVKGGRGGRSKGGRMGSSRQRRAQADRRRGGRLT